MAGNKTRKTDANVEDYLNSVENKRRREDSFQVLAMMKEITGEEPKMWGPSIVGFGEYHYAYDSGREGDSFLTGFAPRKQSLTLYIMPGFAEYSELLGNLGKYKTGKSCLYINKLDDVHIDTLQELIRRSYLHMKATNP